MKTFLKWLAGVLAVFFLLILTFVIFIGFLIDTEPKVVNNSYLYMRLSGAIPEYVAPDPIEEALGAFTLDVKRFRENLEKAQVDDRINGVILEISYNGISYSKIQEVHRLISKFKESGKKIFAYLGSEMAVTGDYYLATACDSIYMSPTANLFINGLGSEITFYKDFFKKIGVEAEFLQIGRYKNAPDVYTRESISPFHKEVLDNMLDYYYTNIIKTISSHRNISVEEVDAFINTQSAVTGSQALNLGLIDGTGYFDEIVEKLNYNGDTPVKVSAADYAEIPISSLDIRNKSRIAIVNCIGTIAGGSDSDDPFMGMIVGANSVAKNLKAAASSRSVKAIILRIDSPGGSAGAADLIWKAVREAAQEKPVIASVSGYGASGGYYIALGADTMITNTGSLVGSIGIFAGKFNIQKLYDKLDINTETFQRGKNAGFFQISEPWTEEQRKVVYNLINDFYQNFLQKVSDSRGLSIEEVKTLAEGHVWLGEEAVNANLFDFSGDFYDAVETAKIMAGIDSSESVRLVYYPKSKSFWGEVFSSIHAKWSQLNQYRIEYLISYINQIQNKPLALMPFMIDIK
ncbi:MAG: signal peptide peptidase SppA [Calditrichaceae bacterium]|nr:signal peptide peptidase SppA [Calditrichaceae bacterium]